VATELIGLAVANELYALIGVGIAGALGVFDARPSTWWRLPAAYLLGVAVVAIGASYAALAGYAVGFGTLLAAAAVSLVAAWLRIGRRVGRVRSGERGAPPNPLAGAIAIGLLGVSVVLLGVSMRLQALNPPVVWDAWAMWELKAHVLYELPDVAPAVVREGDYGHPTYPLALPALYALGFRAMGRFDSVLIGLQLAFLLVGAVTWVWCVWRDRCSPVLVALVLTVLVSAPQLHVQLASKLADVPLGLFVGAGLVAFARWLADGGDERWPLASGALLLGCAGLMKNEGLMFAAAAGLALMAGAAVEPRARLRDAAAALAAVAAIVLPWRVYTVAHELPATDYDLVDLLRPGVLAEQFDRVGPVVRELWTELTWSDHWGWIVAIALLAIVGAAAAGDGAIATFAAVWLGLAFGGLVATYWISSLPLEFGLSNTSRRTIVSLAIGAACLTIPLLARVPETVRLWFSLRSRSSV
jgi:hypothetical protein